jgi:hypothetical protein
LGILNPIRAFEPAALCFLPHSEDPVFAYMARFVCSGPTTECNVTDDNSKQIAKVNSTRFVLRDQRAKTR